MLEVDHVDGNPDNHLPTNLRLLCPNCHSQTPTFRKKNKDGPKSDRRSKLRRALYVKPFQDRSGSGWVTRTPNSTANEAVQPTLACTRNNAIESTLYLYTIDRRIATK